MQIAITCRHGQLNPSVREHIQEKSQKLLTYFERVASIEVTVDFQGDLVRVDLLVDTEHKHDFVAMDEGESIGPTFDRALHKMEHQIKKYKQKLQDHRRDRPLSEMIGSGSEDENA